MLSVPSKAARSSSSVFSPLVSCSTTFQLVPFVPHGRLSMDISSEMLSFLECCCSPSNSLPVSENQDGVHLIWLSPPPTPHDLDEEGSDHRDLADDFDDWEVRYRWTNGGEMTGERTGRRVPQGKTTTWRDIRGGGACCCVLGARAARGGVAACR